jgi:hypothetical protein
MMNNSSPSDISSTTGKEHPVATATLDHFILQDDEKEFFLVDGKEWPIRELKVDVLRKFAAKNNIKRSQPPYHSLGRNSTKAVIVHELLQKIARRDNGQPDPWLPSVRATTTDKKCSYVNRYRLDNVVFSDGLREDVLRSTDNRNLDSRVGTSLSEA